jgi:mono/diheme cytochrome c family protein
MNPKQISSASRLSHQLGVSIIKARMRFRVPSASFAAFASVMGLAVGIAGCRSLPPSKPASEWNSEEARGAQVFQRNCARCHYPTKSSGLHGPGLQAITKIKAMPSGAPPTDERLSATILRGHGTMPGTPLDDDQLRDLLAYLHSL